VWNRAAGRNETNLLLATADQPHGTGGYLYVVDPQPGGQLVPTVLPRTPIPY
jgi:hypothetical protein